MRLRTVILVALVAVIVVALIFLYPYITFKPPVVVSSNWGFSSQSSLVSVVFYMDFWLRNPNPYTISIISSSITVTYDDGVTINLQPEYLPVEIPSHSVNTTIYIGGISPGQATQLALSPPTSYVASWQVTLQTPLGIKTITCTATIYITTNQTSQTCTE
ncbi:MAG: hypothetical protein RXQ96_04500 [Thermocladium sp.]